MMRVSIVRFAISLAGTCCLFSMLGAALPAVAQTNDVSSPLYVAENHCAQTAPLDPDATVYWNGWGPDVTNTRFQDAVPGGITAGDIGHLRLAWVYGLPREQQARGQPAVVGDRLFVGSQAGAVYALNAATGCTHWQFFPEAGLRSATSVGRHQFEDGRQGLAVYFVDAQGWAYALNADSGDELWRTRIEDHASVRGTGALTLYDGRLYVPMTGINEAMSGASPDYECCTFRGSLTAVDAASGEIVWKTYTVGESERRGTSSAGVPLWGPAGVGIWNAPTIDVERGLIYSGTGPAYADTGDTPPTTDAVVAFDIDSGEIQWINQFTPDVWLSGCDGVDNPNCPTNQGPDLDFSASPILTQTLTGDDIIVIPQKSGMVHALDPARDGATLWSYRAGPGGPVGGVWGSAVENNRMYVAVGGYNNAETGGIHAIDIDTGERIWYTPPAPLLCEPGRGCSQTQAAAVTAVPGALFSGSADGGLRAYAAEDGEILWTFDANRVFETVNGIEGRGASFSGPGPVVANGMLYVLSGDAGFVGRPGNVLLAFSVDGAVR